MKILNLGCGLKTSSNSNVINIDWSIYLIIKRNFVLNKLANILLDKKRLKRLNEIPNNIYVHDLSKGIPFENDSVDVVYHSHVLEHLEKEVAKDFIKEAKRVLKPNGILRIVVPDFEVLARKYIQHLDISIDNIEEQRKHDGYISNLLEQSVRLESVGTSQQSHFRRFIENLILGSARKRGENHLWMYDRINLQYILKTIGFQSVSIKTFDESFIKDWHSYGLDMTKDGNQIQPESLYMEAIK